VDNDKSNSKRASLWLAVTLVAFLVVEGSVFRLGWYNKYFEPDSAAGALEMRMYWLRRFRSVPSGEILVVGDSRIAEGFSGPQANERALQLKQTKQFWNIGIAGTTPRVWYYLLRDADPTRRRFDAIAIALADYADEDSYDSPNGRLLDLNFLIGRLRLTDAWDFASSMQKPELRNKALLGAVLKGTVIRTDARLFLQDIQGRITKSKLWREHGMEYVSGYGGNDHNLSGLSADLQARTVRFPAGMAESQQDHIRRRLFSPPTPQTGELTRYRKFWLGRILELYRNSPTRIVFLELPRGPLINPSRPASTTFVDWARKQPNVVVLHPETFRSLETPETFFDGLHLNRSGRTIFSARLAEKLLDAVPKS
jgi:hypothetical protein